MIRRLCAEDFDRALDQWIKASMVVHGSIPEIYWDRQYYRMSKEMSQSEVYIYEQDGHVGGFIGMKGNLVAGLHVVPEARCLGIGKLLINNVKQSHTLIKLLVYAENSGAVRFYLRQGFVTESRHQDRETGKEELLMTWHKTQRASFDIDL